MREQNSRLSLNKMAKLRKKTRILVVEDESIVAADIQKTLQNLGYDVPAVASTGEAAIQKAKEDKPDLVLMDIVLKGKMDGVKAAEQIRTKFNIPVVYLTAYADDKTLKRAKITGPFGYIIKPFEDRALKTIIEIALYKAKIENELKASKASFHNIVEKSADGIVVVDRDGIVQFVNHAAEALFGRKAKELVGELFGFPVTGGEVIELDVVRHSREPGIAEMRVVETEWNGQAAYLALLRDVTERKRAEEKLKKANEKLKEYNQLKSEFVSTASHELRTPLSIIAGAIRLILDEIPGKIVAEQRDVLATAMENVKRLGRIVDSLLSISKIESGKLDLQKSVVNICELIEDTVSNYKPIAQEKAISLDCEVPQQGIDICLDPDKTKQILINLISNSLKFTPQGGWVKVTCAEQDGEVLVSVQDCGVGIAKQDIPKLFDKFTQFGRKAGPGEKGTGLGLAICKGIVEQHKGRIWAESDPGKGSKFTFTLPRYSTEELLEQYVKNAIAEALKNDAKVLLIIVSIADFDKLKQKLANEEINSLLRDMKTLLENNLRRASLQRAGDTILQEFNEVFVILASCNKENALSVEQRLAHVLDDYLDGQNSAHKIKLLFGCATYPDDASTDKELINKAKELRPIFPVPSPV